MLIESQSWLPFMDAIHSHDNHTHRNSSIDVLTKNCMHNYDTLACIRGSALSFVCIITGVLALQRALALRSGRTWKHRQLILYLCALHAMTGALEWYFGWTTNAALLCSYLRSLELIILTHYHISLVSRVLRSTNDKTSRYSTATLLGLLLYFTIFILLAYVYAIGPWYDCYAVYWIYVSVGQVSLVQVLSFCCYKLWKKLDVVCADLQMKNEQKLQMMLVMLTLQTSVFSDLFYHLTMTISADETSSCSGVFHHSQKLYTGLRVIDYMVIYLMPLWTIIFVFGQEPNTARQYDVLTDSEEDSMSSTNGAFVDASDNASLIPPANTLLQSNFIDPFLATTDNPNHLSRAESALGVHINGIIATARNGGRIIIRGAPRLNRRGRLARLAHNPSQRANVSNLGSIHEERDGRSSND